MVKQRVTRKKRLTPAEASDYASLLAHELWYQVREVEHVKRGPGWKGVQRREDRFLLHVVRRGELQHEIRQRRFTVRQTEACLLDLSPAVVRYRVTASAPAEFYRVWLNGKDMPRVFRELDAAHDPVFPLRDLRTVVLVLQELATNVARKPVAYEVRNSGLLTLLLAELFASGENRAALRRQDRALSETVRQAIDYIARHYDKRDVTVQGIAFKLFRLNVKQFSRRFQREVGMGALAYLNCYRIEQAKKFLAGSNQSVKQIARSVGFHDQQYFTRTFTRIVGVTPLSWRKQPGPPAKLAPRLALRGRRAYLKDPKQFSYWKKSPSRLGIGTEILNYPSPVARELWYYVRSLGHASHRPAWKMEHHDEDGFVLHVVERGQLWHLSNGSKHIAGPGQACLLNLSRDVSYGVEGGVPAAFHWAWLNGKDMPRVFLELRAGGDSIFSLRDPRRVGACFRELEAIITREPSGYEARSSGLLTLILAELFASRADRTTFPFLAPVTRPLSEPVRRAVDQIIRCHHRDLTVKYLAADVARQSLTHFSRRFHQEVGMSPIAYLNRFRIEQAKQFLTGSNQSVAQIARSVGFRNPDYFARTFVRMAGVTPRAYRKKPESSRRSR